MASRAPMRMTKLVSSSPRVLIPSQPLLLALTLPNTLARPHLKVSCNPWLTSRPSIPTLGSSLHLPSHPLATTMFPHFSRSSLLPHERAKRTRLAHWYPLSPRILQNRRMMTMMKDWTRRKRKRKKKRVTRTNANSSATNAPSDSCANIT